MCWSQYPPNVSQKKSKGKKFDILHYRNCLFLVCTMNDNISGGVTKWNFPREGGSILWADFGKSRREGGIGKISSVGDYGYFLDELRPSKWYRCGRENPVSYRQPSFRGRSVLEQVKVLQIPMTKADLFLRIFEAIPGTYSQTRSSVPHKNH